MSLPILFCREMGASGMRSTPSTRGSAARLEEHGGAIVRAEKPHAIFSDDGERPFGI